jgi:CBS domain-containing protein
MIGRAKLEHRGEQSSRCCHIGRTARRPEVAMFSVQQLLDQKPKGIFSIAPDDPVLAAIRKMADHHVGALLVMRADQLVGIVSERDYARKVVLLGRSSTETRVEAIMTAKVVTVTPKQDAHDCMRLMTDMRIRHLPVVSGDRVVGVLSIGDLVRAVIEEQERTIADLETYIRS